MKARIIIDDVSSVPHPFKFRGRVYDLQKSFTVTREIRRITAKEEYDELEVLLHALAAMMNDDLIRNGDRSERITPELLSAWIPADQFAEIEEYLSEILVPGKKEEEAVDTSDLDELIDDELPEETKN